MCSCTRHRRHRKKTDYGKSVRRSACDCHMMIQFCGGYPNKSLSAQRHTREAAAVSAFDASRPSRTDRDGGGLPLAVAATRHGAGIGRPYVAQRVRLGYIARSRRDSTATIYQVHGTCSGGGERAVACSGGATTLPPSASSFLLIATPTRYENPPIRPSCFPQNIVQQYSRYVGKRLTPSSSYTDTFERCRSAYDISL